MKVELKEVSVGYQTPLVEGANALLESGDLVAPVSYTHLQIRGLMVFVQQPKKSTAK